MPKSEMKEALLKQSGPTTVEAELVMLKGLVESEHRRARWLRFWTIAVWGTFFAVLAVLIVARPFRTERAPDVPVGVQPAIPAAPVVAKASPLMSMLGVSVVTLLLLALVALPPAGIVLLILMVLAHRSASLTQLRASVAAIEAQLRLLQFTQKTLQNRAES